MKEPYRILIPYFTRSEWGPLTPLLNVMKKDERLEAITVPKKMDNLQTIDDVLTVLSPDMVLCGFDRPEMVPVAYAAYHRRIPIAQIFAGDIAGGAFDDRDRFVISNFADLLFCSEGFQKRRVEEALAWRTFAEDQPRIVVSGATHFDDMETDASLVPRNNYTLVLYNPPSLLSREQIVSELKLVDIIGNPWPIVWVAPNGDKNSDVVEEFAKAHANCTYLESQPRDRFLGLLEFCQFFVSNSSALAYEAPYFKRPVERMGIRNSIRYKLQESECKPGASKIICDEIVKYLDVKKDG